MKTLNRRDFPGAQYPERIIQFGEGNFLRAFVDWQIDLLNVLVFVIMPGTPVTLKRENFGGS